jgi:hypothetical protein
MAEIAFTQYLMPDGRTEVVFIDRPSDIAAKAEKIEAAGYSFAVEMLRDYRTVSLTIENDDGDFDIEVCPNGPGVPVAIDRMINRAAERLGGAS